MCWFIFEIANGGVWRQNVLVCYFPPILCAEKCTIIATQIASTMMRVKACRTLCYSVYFCYIELVKP